MDLAHEFFIAIDQVEDYEFRVTFDKPKHPVLSMDEPPPLGQDAGPNAARILAAAIGNCLSASLLFCARRNGVKTGNIHTEVRVQIVRTENRRLRVGRVDVAIDPALQENEVDKAQSCLALFEDYCTVTQSIRQGIPVSVAVKGF